MPSKPPLRYTEELSVTAPVPKRTDPFPENLREIILGSKTKRPEGAFIDPSLKGPTITNPLLRDIWAQIAQEYPAAASQATSVQVVPDVGEGYTAWVDDMGSDRPMIGVSERDVRAGNRNVLKEALLHELTHVLQAQNFPDFREGMRASIAGRPYMSRPGEQQAYEIGLKRKP